MAKSEAYERGWIRGRDYIGEGNPPSEEWNQDAEDDGEEGFVDGALNAHHKNLREGAGND